MNIKSFETFFRTRKGLRRKVEPLYYWLLAFGIDMRRFIPALIGLPSVLREYRALKKQNKAIGSKWKLRFTMPVTEDRYSSAGKVSGHYFHQDLLVARKIFQRKPVKHVDVGSRIDGFVAHVATFRPIEVFDIRPLDVGIPNIIFKHVDLMDPEMELKDYCDSLSCLHVLEHLGLGRYGDQIDINGHLRGFNNLHKLLQRGGILYLSVPIGPERINFNAHRVFAIKTVLEMAKDRFELIGFSYVDDKGDLYEDVILDLSMIANNCWCYYGCGIFEFKKVN
jgi:SAM-dependent methyltransferase